MTDRLPGVRKSKKRWSRNSFLEQEQQVKRALCTHLHSTLPQSNKGLLWKELIMLSWTRDFLSPPWRAQRPEQRRWGGGKPHQILPPSVWSLFDSSLNFYLDFKAAKSWLLVTDLKNQSSICNRKNALSRHSDLTLEQNNAICDSLPQMSLNWLKFLFWIWWSQKQTYSISQLLTPHYCTWSPCLRVHSSHALAQRRCWACPTYTICHVEKQE